MYKLTQQTQVRKITPKEAEGFLAINNFPGQRNLNHVKARYYADMLVKGAFRPVNISVVTFNRLRYLVNGQHVCTACIMAGKEMAANVDYYRCDSREELWALYASFDVNPTRTQGDIFKGARGQLSDARLHDVSLKHLAACGTALFNVMRPEVCFGLTTLDKGQKVKLVDDNPEFVIWSGQFHETRYMATVGVLSAMIATWNANREKAFEFWPVVRDGIGFTGKSDPRYLLRERLRDGLGEGMRARSGQFAEYATCISFWNDWRTGNTRRSVKVASMKSAPKPVK
jgi:cold shock CspA family protein